MTQKPCMAGNKEGSTNEQLLSRIASGDPKAFQELLVRYESTVYHFVLKLVKIPDVAEEITQDTFLKLWQLVSEGTPIENLPAWMYTVSRNLGVNKLKESAARKLRETAYAETAVQDQDPYDDIAARDIQRAIDETVDRMPDKRKVIFRLKTERGLTNDQIGHLLHVSPHTVKNQLTKSYSVLRKLMKNHIYLVLIFQHLT